MAGRPEVRRCRILPKHNRGSGERERPVGFPDQSPPFTPADTTRTGP